MNARSLGEAGHSVLDESREYEKEVGKVGTLT
jgi:hypothetical protein